MYSTPNIIRMMKGRKQEMGGASGGHGKKRNANLMSTTVRSMCKLQGNIERNITEN
jgi:hypothetical protein